MAAEIQINSTGQLTVTGELSLASIPELCKVGYQFINKCESPVFDLRNVIAEDNSGLALLTAWARFANQLNKPVCFINLPNQLLDIARLSRLEEILPIKRANNG